MTNRQAENVRSMAEKHDLPPSLVAAMCQVESAFNPFATRYEAEYRWLVPIGDHVATTIETELIHQRTSWGLMQIMGATARDLGYKGSLPALVGPWLGLDWGCKFLRKQIDRYDGALLDAVSAFNQGSARRDPGTGKYCNQQYVDKVVAAAGNIGYQLTET